MGPSVFVNLHFFDGEGGVVDLLNGAQPVDEDTFLLGFGRFEIVGGHFLPRPAVDDHGFIDAQPLGGAGRIHGRIAATVNNDPAAQLRRFGARLHVMQYAGGVENFTGGVGRNIDPLGQMSADGDKDSVEPFVIESARNIFDLMVEFQSNTQIENALNFAIQNIPGQAVFGDAEPHHTARHGSGLADGYLVTHAPQMIGRRQTAGTGADNEHPFFRRLRVKIRFPAVFQGLVAQEAFNRVDRHGLVQLSPIAGAFAGVITDPSHYGGHGVVLDQFLPGVFVIAFFGMEQPALNIFTRRAGVVAGRQAIPINGHQIAPRTRVIGQAGAGVQGNGVGQWLVRIHAHAPPPSSGASSSRPKRSIL